MAGAASQDPWSPGAIPATTASPANPIAPTPDRPWLVGDVGGTNARFALLTHQRGDLATIRRLRCTGHRDLAGLIREYREQVGDPKPSLACIALAGPVTGDRCRTTNAQLDFSINDTTRSLDLQQLHLINDFAAVALAVPDTPARHAVRIGAPTPAPGLPIAVLGPGTGLGVATLAPVPDQRNVVLAGEGGHVLLTPVDEVEFELVHAARLTGLTLTAEMAISGPGVVRLYQLLHHVHGTAALKLSPENICARALKNTDPLCLAALTMFCKLLGGVASSVALTTGARGGVYLAGGILPKIADFLTRSEFRTRFETNPTMNAYLCDIATTLITDPNLGLRGAAAALTGVTAAI